MAEGSMLRMWWGRLLFGVLLVLFGVVAIAWPGITAEIFVTVFGVFILLIGIIKLFYGATQEGMAIHRILYVL
jgi:uncharacterized membrane protein HdeD (DUF308 family)